MAKKTDVAKEIISYITNMHLTTNYNKIDKELGEKTSNLICSIFAKQIQDIKKNYNIK